MSGKQSKAAYTSSPLFTHTAQHGLSFGVLRTHYKEYVNDASKFVAGKLAPALPEGASWQLTAARSEVLLPDGVPDLLLDPLMLTQSYMDQLPPKQLDLLLCFRAVLDPHHPLHSGWERARSFARKTLVKDHGLPVIMVLHDPCRSGTKQPNPPHIHIMAPARRLVQRGWAECTNIACDEAQPGLVEAWRTTEG